MTATDLLNVGPLALVGAGKMGGAMLQGWLALGLDPAKVSVFDPQPAADLLALAGKGVVFNPPKSAVRPSVIVLAVKPQIAADLITDFTTLAGRETLVLSIMAGKTLGFLRGGFPDAAIVRAMPNTPAAIGRGITVAVAGASVTPAQRAIADRLLSATGAVEWTGDENLMDAVTAVSGSGPAYVFLLAETLAQAGEAAGLPRALAEKLARATVAGSGELLHRSDSDPATLRQNVTSPNGTTAAALDVLMRGDALASLMRQAVAAATNRSRELAG